MNMRHAMFVTVLSGMLAATSAFGQAPPPTAHIGVVNMVKVFHSLQETKDVEAKLEADNNSLKSLKDDHQSHLTEMEQEIRNGPKPDTDQYDMAVQKLDQQSVAFESELKLKQVELTRNQTKQLKSIFDKIESSVADIAKTKGLDLVLTEMKPELAPGQQNSMTPDQLSQILTQRNVLYAGDNIDITSDVIAAMDAKYKSGAK